MGPRIDVGIHPYREWRPAPQPFADRVQRLELLGAFDIEEENAGLQGARHFLGGLADAGEDNLRWIRAGGDRPIQLSSRHDVKARSEAREQPQQGEVRARFYRIANEVRVSAEGLGEHAEMPLQRRGG